MSGQRILSDRLVSAAVGVLGSMLIDESVIPSLLEQLRPSDFPLAEHRHVFEAIRSLHGEQRPVDAITVNSALGGGYSELLISLMELTPTSANAEAYLEDLLDASQLWQLQTIGQQLADAGDASQCRELLDRANSLLAQRTGLVRTTMTDGLVSFFNRLDGKGWPSSMTFGLGKLDEFVHPRAGSMVVIGGYPSAGKTAFALQIAAWVGKGKRVGFYSYETSAELLMERYVANAADISYKRIANNRMTDEDYKCIFDSRRGLSAPHVDFVEAVGMTVADIRTDAIANQYDVVMVDYLQQIPEMSSRHQDLSEYDRVTRVSRGLQQLGRKTGKTVVALAQLSRGEKSKGGAIQAPTMASLRQSGQIEQDADVVLLLYKEQPDDPRSRRCLDIAKNKDGEAGVGMKLDFDGDKQRFSIPAAQKWTPPPKPTEPQTSLWKEVSPRGSTPFDDGKEITT